MYWWPHWRTDGINVSYWCWAGSVQRRSSCVVDDTFNPSVHRCVWTLGTCIGDHIEICCANTFGRTGRDAVVYVCVWWIAGKIWSVAAAALSLIDHLSELLTLTDRTLYCFSPPSFHRTSVDQVEMDHIGVNYVEPSRIICAFSRQQTLTTSCEQQFN